MVARFLVHPPRAKRVVGVQAFVKSSEARVRLHMGESLISAKAVRLNTLSNTRKCQAGLT
jgi:hypothetical protein